MSSKSSSCRLEEKEKQKKDHELHIKCFLTFVVESSNIIFSTRNDQVGGSCEEIEDGKKQVTDKEISNN